MTAKEYLKQIEKWQAQINNIREKTAGRLEKLQQELEALYTQAQGMRAITYDRDRVQVSPGNTLEDLMVLINDASAEYAKAITTERLTANRKIATLQGKIDKATDLIDSLDDIRYATILRLRYVDCKRWEAIACDMTYTYRHVLRVHGEALQAFSKTWH